MEPLTSKNYFAYRHNSDEIVGTAVAGLPISTQSCHAIHSYEDLLSKISALNFYNSSLQIVFRGQDRDYYSNGNKGKPVRSNLYPSLLRSLPMEQAKRREKIKERIEKLTKAEDLLKARLKDGYIHRHRLVRWAILQHYEVCSTPLLDVTSSLQTAVSFALSNGGKEGFLYAIGLPHQSGPLSVSIESMTQLVDLSKLCPPAAARPHYQHGLLVGDYPTGLDTNDLVSRAPKVSANFSCRLLSKFHLKNTDGWVGKHFFPTPTAILYPNDRDTWYPVLADIKEEIR